MRKILLVFLSTFTLCVHAQKDTTVIYYDWQGKVCQEDKAVKFALVVKEPDRYKKLMVDGMDNRVEWIGYFADPDCKISDGLYRAYYKNGVISESGIYSHDLKFGVWKIWYEDGKIADSVVYDGGFIKGLGLAWDKQGRVTDSLLFGENGKGEGRGYWSNGNPRERGPYVGGKKNGAWTYYYETGIKCQEVIYAADSAMSYTCFDESGNLQPGKCIYEEEASFPGGDKKWSQYLSRKLSSYRLPDMKGTVVVQFVVGTDGVVGDVKVFQSVHPQLDEIAIDIIKHSPRWNHAIQFNRPVKAYRRQPITFVSSSD